MEVNDDENEVVGDLNAPNKDTNTEKDESREIAN